MGLLLHPDQGRQDVRPPGEGHADQVGNPLQEKPVQSGTQVSVWSGRLSSDLQSLPIDCQCVHEINAKAFACVSTIFVPLRCTLFKKSFGC